jgi:hypothetical protein
MKMEFRDPVVQRVCQRFVDRSDIGFKKYGRTLHNERTEGHKDLAAYLNDIQEELMDAVLYIQAAREAISDPHGPSDDWTSFKDCKVECTDEDCCCAPV